MSIITKKGDDGSTILHGEKMLKCDIIFDVLGIIDEASAFIGLLKCNSNSSLAEDLKEMQEILYLISSEISTTKCYVSSTHLENIENKTKLLENTLSKQSKFVKAGKSYESTISHIVRTLIRNIERKIVRLSQNKDINEKTIFPIINRMSDYFYVLAESLY